MRFFAAQRINIFQFCIAGSYCRPFNGTVSKKKKKLGSKTTAAAVPPLSITVTLPLAAWGPKFLFDLKCQHRCPDNFHSVTLPVCPQMQRALIGAGKRWGCLSISLVGEMKQPHSDPLSPKKKIPFLCPNFGSHEGHSSNTEIKYLN